MLAEEQLVESLAVPQAVQRAVWLLLRQVCLGDRSEEVRLCWPRVVQQECRGSLL